MLKYSISPGGPGACVPSTCTDHLLMDSPWVAWFSILNYSFIQLMASSVQLRLAPAQGWSGTRWRPAHTAQWQVISLRVMSWVCSLLPWDWGQDGVPPARPYWLAPISCALMILQGLFLQYPKAPCSLVSSCSSGAISKCLCSSAYASLKKIVIKVSFSPILDKLL